MTVRSLFVMLLVVTLTSVPSCKEQPQQADSTTQSGLNIPADSDGQVAEATSEVVPAKENWPLPGFSLPPGYELVEFKSDGENLWQATFNSALDYEATLKHVDEILLPLGYEKDVGMDPSPDGFVIRYDNPLADLSVMFMFIRQDEETRGKFPDTFDYTLGVFRSTYVVKE